MNTSVLEPLNRLHFSSGLKVLAVQFSNNKLYVGLSNGDLRIYRVSSASERETVRFEARSVKSFRSFSEVRRLFADNETSQVLVLQKEFPDVFKTQAAVTSLRILPIYSDHSREVLLLGSADTLQVYEWVGPYLNLVRTFDEIRAYGHVSYIDLLGHKKSEFNGEELEDKLGNGNSARAAKNGHGPQDKRALVIKMVPSQQSLSENSSIALIHEKLLLISARKRLYMFVVVRRSRNIYDFDLMKELVLKERILKIHAFPDHAQVLIATSQNVYSLNLRDGATEFALEEIAVKHSKTSPINSFGAPSSFSYFGLLTSGPRVSIIPLLKTLDSALVVRDTDVGLLRFETSGVVLTESAIKVTSAPISVSFLLPCYVVFVHAKHFEVVDVESGIVVQSFKHLLNYTADFHLLGDSMMTIAEGADVLQFKVLTIQKQLDNYLAMRGHIPSVKQIKDPRSDLRILGLERAITLVGSLDDSDAFFADPKALGSKQKQLFLRDLYKEKTCVYFEVYLRFHEALSQIASEWMVSFLDVLDLFPDFLNGHVQIKQTHSSQSQALKHVNPVKKVTISELQTISEKAGRSIASSDSSVRAGSESTDATNALPQKIKSFHKAVQNLIVFLTDQRRVHISFLNSLEDDPFIPWKGLELRVSDLYPGIDRKILHTRLIEYASSIDTSLFLCYYFTKPMLLGPLLRLPHNRCNARVVNECLLKGSNLDQLDQIRFISQLLDFYFGRSMHEEALRLLNKLATEGLPVAKEEYELELAQLLRGPSLSIRYMQRLSNEFLDLILKYAHWILSGQKRDVAMENARLIFMNDSFECEGYDRFRVLDYLTGVIKSDLMGIAYLEWLLNESGIFEGEANRKEIPKLSTRLCLLYLKRMTRSKADEKFYESSAYRKMKRLLENGIEYEPWTVLKNIPTSEDKYLRLTVFIYHRLGEHQKLVDILYNQLGDLDEAMEYCAKVYDEPNMKSAGEQLLFKLLEDLLMHYNENQNLIARLVTLQGDKMPTLQLLTALPDSFPLHKLSLFLKTTSQRLENKIFDSRIKSLLYKIGASKVHYELVMEQAMSYKIEGPAQPCGVCGKELGLGVTCVNEAGKIVHYGCLKT